MNTRMLASLREIDAREFDLLDPSAGAAASHARLVQREGDGRWRTRYLVAEGPELCAAIPLYTPRVDAWPDPSYDPATWFAGGGEPASPRTCLLAGNCTDLRGSLHLAARLPDAQLRDLLVQLAAIAAQEERALALPYLYDDARARVDAMLPGVEWSALGQEGYFGGLEEPDWQLRLRSRERSYLKRDRRLIETAGPSVAVVPFADVEDEACRMIAEHNVVKGRPDHPEFARMRYQEWGECADTTCIALVGGVGDARGVLAGVIWNQRLELLEIGLEGPEGAERLATYLQLLFHQPFELAAQAGLHTVSLGPESHRVKAARGASFHTLNCGYLSRERTRNLACDVRVPATLGG